MADVLPRSEDVEAALIARLLVDSEQIPLVASRLPAEDFYVGELRQAFRAMQELSAQRKRVDLTTLSDALGDKTGSLGDTIMRVPHMTAPIEEYIEIVRRDAFRRRVILDLGEIIAQAQVVTDRGELLTELHDLVVRLSSNVDNDNLVSPIQAVEMYEHQVELRRHGLRGGLAYGFPALDGVLNPAMPGDMIVLAARPSVGKTALAENVADYWAHQAEGPVLFASLEMSVGSILDRTIARLTGVPAKKIVRGVMDDAEAALAHTTIEQRRSVGIWYLDDGNATTASLRAAAAKTRLMAGSLGGIVIDYLQLLKDPGDQEVQRVTKISRQVKAIAREFDVPVLVLSQLSRAVMQREDQHPRLHDLRESGAIEQDADVVIGLYRELGSSTTDVDVLKQRQGGVGRVQLSFDEERVRFSDATAGALRRMGEIVAATGSKASGGGVLRPLPTTPPYWDTERDDV